MHKNCGSSATVIAATTESHVKRGTGHLSWEAQQRLCSRLIHFTNSGKARNKAIVALARELAGFIRSLGQVSQRLA